MQRIRNGTQIAALPPLDPAVGVPGYFGNTANGGPTRVGQDFLNDLQEEIVQVILAAGIALSVNDRTQLLQAIQALISGAAAPFLIDTGLANAYVLTPATPIVGYAVGQRWAFKAAHANTGAASVNVSGVGAAALQHRDGSDLQAGDIPAGSVNTITSPDGVAFQLESQIPTLATTALAGLAQLATNGQALAMLAGNVALTPANLAAVLATTGTLGLAQLATNVQAQAMASGSVALTPANLAAVLATTAALGLAKLSTDAQAKAMAATNVVLTPSNLAALFAQNLALPGYVTLPGGLILQWGGFSVASNGASQSVTFPISFPTGVLAYWTGVDNAASSQLGMAAITLSGASVFSGIDDNFARTGRWFAIGH